jgi:hypothetical protein
MKRAIIVAVLAFIAASETRAQTACFSLSDLTKAARDKWTEHPAAAGVVANGVSRVVVFASERGTFTLAVVDQHGRACVVMTGDGWATINPPTVEANP